MKTLVLAFVLIASQAFAQPPGTAKSKLLWDQPAQDLVTAQSYTYTFYADGALTGTSLVGVTCSGTATPFVCAVAYPAFTPGLHVIQLTASNPAGESVKSGAFSFTFVVQPQPPGNLRIGH